MSEQYRPKHNYHEWRISIMQDLKRKFREASEWMESRRKEVRELEVVQRKVVADSKASESKKMEALAKIDSLVQSRLEAIQIEFDRKFAQALNDMADKNANLFAEQNIDVEASAIADEEVGELIRGVKNNFERKSDLEINTELDEAFEKWRREKENKKQNPSE